MKFSPDEKFSENFIKSFKQNFMTFYTSNTDSIMHGSFSSVVSLLLTQKYLST